MPLLRPLQLRPPVLRIYRLPPHLLPEHVVLRAALRQVGLQLMRVSGARDGGRDSVLGVQYVIVFNKYVAPEFVTARTPADPRSYLVEPAVLLLHAVLEVHHALLQLPLPLRQQRHHLLGARAALQPLQHLLKKSV